MSQEIISLLPLALPLAVLGGIAGGSTGIGIYLVIGPVLWQIGSPTEAMGAALAAGLPVWALFIPLWRYIDWPSVKRMLLPALPGLIVGFLLHVFLPQAALQAGAGALVILALLARYREGALPLPGAGLAAGALSSSVGFNGTPVFFAFSGQNEKKQRANVRAVLTALGLAVLLMLPLADREEFQSGFTAGLLLLPGVGLGIWLGHKIAGRADKKIEYIAAAISLVGAGLLLWQALF